MPRRSAASIATPTPPRPEAARLQPPAHLTPEARSVWRDVVKGKPAGWWFAADCAPVLAAYADAVIQQRLLAQAVTAASTPEALAARGGSARWLGLLESQQKQDRHVAMLATRLRLTPQSRYTPKAAANAANLPKKRPWEFAGN